MGWNFPDHDTTITVKKLFEFLCTHISCGSRISRLGVGAHQPPDASVFQRNHMPPTKELVSWGGSAHGSSNTRELQRGALQE